MVVTRFINRDGKWHDRTIVAFAAGDEHTLFISSEGKVFTTGAYKDMEGGELADNHNGERSLLIPRSRIIRSRPDS
jgi:alpha-tubulin suppressor-like RCC1 family protein